MAVIPLRYGVHWQWVHFAGDPYEWNPNYPNARLLPEVHGWMSRNKVRHSLVTNGAAIEAICILDSRQAMLFKLTWM